MFRTPSEAWAYLSFKLSYLRFVSQAERISRWILHPSEAQNIRNLLKGTGDGKRSEKVVVDIGSFRIPSTLSLAAARIDISRENSDNVIDREDKISLAASGFSSFHP